MSVLDASVLIAYLTDEVAADEVEAIITDPDDPPVVSAVNWAEVADQLVRVNDIDAGEVAQTAQLLVNGGLTVQPVDQHDGWLMGSLRAAHYHRSRAPLSLADCAALAAAVRLDARLVTSDRPLAAVGRQVGLEVVPVPDSTGRRPA